MKKIITLSALLFVSMCSALVAGSGNEKVRIAVMDLKGGTSISKETVKTVSNMIRTDLIDMGEFSVIERDQMDSILKEHEFQQSGFADQAEAAKMGKVLAAKKILIGEISTLGKGIIMTVRIVDVEKGISEFAASEKSESEDMLDGAVNRLARKLAARIETRRSEEIISNTPSGYYMRGLVPGWAQAYSGHYYQAAGFGVAFWGTAAWTVVSIINFNSKKSKYDDLGPGLDQSTYSSKYDDYKKSGKIAMYSVIGLAAIYGLNAVDVLFFSKPEGNSVSSAPAPYRPYVDLNVEQGSGPDNAPEVRAELSVSMSF